MTEHNPTPTPSRFARLAGALLVVSMVAGLAAVSIVVFAVVTGAWWWLFVAAGTFLLGVLSAGFALMNLYLDFYGRVGE